MDGQHLLLAVCSGARGGAWWQRVVGWDVRGRAAGAAQRSGQAHALPCKVAGQDEEAEEVVGNGAEAAAAAAAGSSSGAGSSSSGAGTSSQHAVAAASLRLPRPAPGRLPIIHHL